MHRLKKLLGMIFILGFVFFIICDEKGYKIGIENNHIVFEKTEKKSDFSNIKQSPKEVVYKDSDLIRIGYDLLNPKTLRDSDGMDPVYLAKLEQERIELEEQKKRELEEKKKQVNTGPSIISLNNESSISSVFWGVDTNQSSGTEKREEKIDVKQETGIIQTEKKEDKTLEEVKEETKEEEIKEEGIREDTVDENIGAIAGEIEDEIEDENPTVYYQVEKYDYEKNTIKLSKGIKILTVQIEQYLGKEKNSLNLNNGKVPEPKILYKNSYRIRIFSGFERGRNIRSSDGMLDLNPQENDDLDLQVTLESEGKNPEIKFVTIQKLELSNHLINITKGKIPEIVLVQIDKYRLNKHILNLKKGIIKQYDFVVENIENTQTTGDSLSNFMLESLLENETIDINTLESENDEFLQKVFEETKDTDVMNLIVETYLNEYQFVKAKKFIEELSENYRDELKPSLNLRLSFNSFSLSSKTTNETLTSLIQNYLSKNQISNEDGNWYFGVLSLMQRDYDAFFDIATGFTSENHKAFTAKLQGYKEQISKQMGMPDYYFDTLVGLELFNEGLFQPAKVLALYSLQQNSGYILPYQILAYANFLTNSWDTSVEYFKKLVDLDPNNAEKYRFLMGVAYYRAEKYEQSVVMLSLIQNDKLRLDTQRYLINDYLKLDQKNKLILSRNKLLGYENLVSSDFYTYFYETFFRPYSEGEQYQLYAFDTELADKMIRVCAIRLPLEEKAVCNYGSIGKNIALGKFEGLEKSLLDLTSEYPQGYLYHALGEYYIHEGDNEKAKIYLLKAVSLSQKRAEMVKIKELLQNIIE